MRKLVVSSLIDGMFWANDRWYWRSDGFVETLSLYWDMKRSSTVIEGSVNQERRRCCNDSS